MNSRKPFLQKFKRVTYSTTYLPQVDGLRFLAIFSVVVIMHITGYMHEKFYGDELVTNGYWRNVVIGGGAGVSLFFVISGFILSLPFAKWRLNGKKPVSLKNYYLRRLTRLEPPYLIALIIFFIANVWVVHKYSFDRLLPHFFASAAYLHTFIYHQFSWVLPVAWSLEVEVQFYVLAPLLFALFMIKNKWVRRGIFLVVIVAGTLYWYDTWKWPHLFKFIHYFFCGLLLADLYCSGVLLIKNKRVGFITGLAALAGFIFIPAIDNFAGYFLKDACMFFLFHTVLTNGRMQKLFSAKGIIIIGGMCYSIYLLHFGIISFAGQLLMRAGIDVGDKNYFMIWSVMFAVIVLAVSAVFFLLVEKPFMQPLGMKKKK